MKNIYLQLLEEQSKGTPLVLATVTSASGSTPQKPGSSAIIGKNGIVDGTVGGGIVEGSVLKLSVNALLSHKSLHPVFNLAHEISEEAEAICGGKISILIDANIQNSLKVFNQIKESLAVREPGVLITMVTGYDVENVLINRYWMTRTVKPSLPDDFMKRLDTEVISILNSGDRSDYRTLELSVEGEEPSSLFFLEPVFPAESLVIAGAGHIGRALAHLGAMLNFEVTVIDDRVEYANSDNIPDADHIIMGDIGKAMDQLKKDANTYVVIVTRGHKDDAAALKSVIASSVAYIGMIGSRKKISAMKSDFLEKSFATIKEWESIYAPVGLEIKSQTVEEIAVSIAAQLVLVRNSKLIK
jgi:xanthine dehydrogenase accessory factor